MFFSLFSTPTPTIIEADFPLGVAAVILYGVIGIASAIELGLTWQFRKQGDEVGFRIMFYSLVDLLCLGKSCLFFSVSGRSWWRNWGALARIRRGGLLPHTAKPFLSL